MCNVRDAFVSHLKYIQRRFFFHTHTILQRNETKPKRVIRSKAKVENNLTDERRDPCPPCKQNDGKNERMMNDR